MEKENSNSNPSATFLASSDSESGRSILERRTLLYDKMARDLNEHGAAFLKGGETSQTLSLSDLFLRCSRRQILPTAVRATVLHLSTEYSIPVSTAVRGTFLPYFNGVIWFQDTSIYHSSLFHASHHLMLLTATDDEVISGTDPAVIRAKLREALPRAPEKQLYDPVVFHTSFARLLGHPKTLLEPEMSSDQLQLFHHLVAELNDKLRGFGATMSELWFVEEYDVLALALNGRMRTRRFPLGSVGN